MPACQLNLLNDQFDNGGIVNELIGFSHNGNQTLVEERRGIPFLWNEFWTARQRQSHKIHEISYRACFKAQLPEFFISRLTSPGDTVYDPFMGRGTTPIQAALMGRKAIGVDINPLSVALTEPRLLQQRLSDIEERLKNIDWSYSGNVDDELLVFFHRETLKQIYALRSWFLDRKESNQLDPTDLWIRMVAINRLTGHSPGFFSVYTMPPNQAVTVDTQKKINMRRAQIPQKKDVPSLILKKSRSLLKDGTITESPGYTLMVASANSTPNIDATSVDLVVTSPPFLDVVQYADDNWLRCWFLNIDPTTVPISIHKRPEEWIKFARGVFN
ncbi:MAG: DNA methyltransferase, partial [Alphaproteobacteria bacterium]|nr:DNA methyltransferase [Alphaproteobacteria bacterium]